MFPVKFTPSWKYCTWHAGCLKEEVKVSTIPQSSYVPPNTRNAQRVIKTEQVKSHKLYFLFVYHHQHQVLLTVEADVPLRANIKHQRGEDPEVMVLSRSIKLVTLYASKSVQELDEVEAKVALQRLGVAKVTLDAAPKPTLPFIVPPYPQATAVARPFDLWYDAWEDYLIYLWKMKPVTFYVPFEDFVSWVWTQTEKVRKGQWTPGKFAHLPDTTPPVVKYNVDQGLLLGPNLSECSGLAWIEARAWYKSIMEYVTQSQLQVLQLANETKFISWVVETHQSWYLEAMKDQELLNQEEEKEQVDLDLVKMIEMEEVERSNQYK